MRIKSKKRIKTSGRELRPKISVVTNIFGTKFVDV